MPPLPAKPTQQQLEAHYRAYILWLIGGVLMPDKMGNQVHLVYLTVLAGLERVRRYSWGSTCLATVYREMCRTTDPDAKTMGSCTSLLQSWAWYHMPFIATRVNRRPSWSGGGLSFTGTPHGDVIGYKIRLDHMTAEQFLWNPYLHFLDALELTTFVDSSIWTACTPNDTKQIELNFNSTFAKTYQIPQETWTNFTKSTCEGQSIIGHAKNSQEYMAWYQSNTIIFLNMQPSSGSSMNFKTDQSSRATNMVQPECNPTYTPFPSMTDYVPPTYTPIPP
ncbi:Serine/threonine-protein phosphatase 7 long form [Glycine max]|nr:Serine/threonine-protein phosphatase 7 long form [Glycine max]